MPWTARPPRFAVHSGRGSDAPEHASLVTRREWVWLSVAAVFLFCARIVFLPPTLDDIDAINFDLGVHDYDPTRFQPHPPGYPVYIALARLTHQLLDSHAAGLAALSALSGSLALVPLYLLVRELAGRTTAVLASVLVITSPLVWFSGARPMSDTTGLAAVLLAQWLLVLGLRRMARDDVRGRRLWLGGTVAAALAVGVRSQALFLVGPVLLFGLLRRRSIRLSTSIAFVAGMSSWFVPMIWQSGGLEAYAASLRLLIATALPAEPLLAAPTIRRAVYGAWDVVGSPWGPPWLAAAVLALALVGGIRCVIWRRAVLGWLLLLFLPYALYHYLLQMTEAIRYAIPVVPLLAVFAASAVADVRIIPRLVAPTLGLAFATVSALWTIPALDAYRRHPSPTAQALVALEQRARDEDVVVAGHPVFERYLTRLAQNHTVLSPDFRRPWQPLADYWQAGQRKPILFLRNPGRTSLLQIARSDQVSLGRWQWPDAVRPFMRGERPSRVELLRIGPPEWFVESGFMLTREAGQPEAVAREPYRLHVRPGRKRRFLMASGAILDRPNGQLALKRRGIVDGSWQLPGEFMIRTMLDPVPASHYIPWTFESDAPVLFTDVWVQEEGRPAIRPAHGFYSAELDDEGHRFRWIAPAAVAQAYAPEPSRLTIRGWIPVSYYDLPMTLTLQWNGNLLASHEIDTPHFVVEHDVPGGHHEAPWGMLRLEASRQFVPDDLQRNGDRRALSAQIHEMILTPRPAVATPIPGR